MKNRRSDKNSQTVTDFHGRPLPESGRPAGYAALVEKYKLPVPLPSHLTAIAERHVKASTDEWQILTPRHQPAHTLSGQLTFALKWEGVELGILAALFKTVKAEEIAQIVSETPTGAYARRLWFLYEWLTGRQLKIAKLGKVRAVPVLDPELQFALSEGPFVSRQKVINNLPGTVNFCPLVRRTPKLEQYRQAQLDRRARDISGRTHPDILARAAAFLLLSDSKSSFQIEGEQPPAQRVARWGQAIGEAGQVQLSRKELERLQRIVIGDARFVHLGLREHGGFVGDHDRRSGEPIPEHISARAEDLPNLVEGLVAFDRLALDGGLDPVVAAATVAFGFVYIHPFEDGNGRLHRWLVHHALARGGFNPPGVVFPISAVILRQIDVYRRVLESYSRPLLNLINWRPTPEGNVEVLNETAGYYRYFDATRHAEFLYSCVAETVEHDLPAEVQYLEAYDKFVSKVQTLLDMPNTKLDILWRFLQQNQGKFSARARSKEFAQLTDKEAAQIETAFGETWSALRTSGEDRNRELESGLPTKSNRGVSSRR
ncbi:MAG TPA: Fic family protein [Terriglobales bacterium]|nr:Fic family protein [Terriglobales bacterium]